MTEQQAIIAYVAEFGSIIPAKMHAKTYRGHFFGSEVTRQCRYLRSKGMLKSSRLGKFTEFFSTDANTDKTISNNPKVEKMLVNIGGQMKEILIHKK